jgi:flavin-dependent dehydrogenase
MAAKACDIAVLGAGPAGTLCAVTLARRGHRVIVVSRLNPAPRFEGLAARVIDILQTHGLREAAGAAGPLVERRVMWNMDSSQTRNTERLIDRRAFDRSLLDDLAAQGVPVLEATVMHVAPTPQGWRIALRTARGPCLLDAAHLVEARGRRAPRAANVALSGPSTTALTRAIAGLPHTPCAAVASFADGWFWLVHAGGGTGHLQLFVDSERTPLPKRAALPAFFDDHVARFGAAAALLDGGRLRGSVTTRNASCYSAAAVIGERMVRIGDAGAGVDPLSGHGIFAALGSALAASAAVHTALARPQNADLARRFYEERTRTGFLRFCRVGREFYAMEERWRDRPFWASRRQWPDLEPSHGSPFAEPVRIEARPVVCDGIVEERRVCITADHPRGVWRIGAVSLADLVDALAARTGASLDAEAPALCERLDCTRGDLDLAVAWLRSRRTLAGADPIALGAGAPRS